MKLQLDVGSERQTRQQRSLGYSLLVESGRMKRHLVLGAAHVWSASGRMRIKPFVMQHGKNPVNNYASWLCLVGL